MDSTSQHHSFQAATEKNLQGTPVDLPENGRSEAASQLK